MLNAPVLKTRARRGSRNFDHELRTVHRPRRFSGVGCGAAGLAHRLPPLGGSAHDVARGGGTHLVACVATGGAERGIVFAATYCLDGACVGRGRCQERGPWYSLPSESDRSSLTLSTRGRVGCFWCFWQFSRRAG